MFLKFFHCKFFCWYKNEVKDNTINVSDIYLDLINDKEIMNIYFKIQSFEQISLSEYNNRECLKKILSYFSELGKLFYLGFISREQLEVFKEFYLVIYNHKDVKLFLQCLKDLHELELIQFNKYEYFEIVYIELLKGSKNV